MESPGDGTSRGVEGFPGRGTPLAPRRATERGAAKAAPFAQENANRQRYMIDRQNDRARHGSSRLRIGLGIVVSLLLMAGTVYAGGPAVSDGRAFGVVSGREAALSAVDTAPSLSELAVRVENVSAGWAVLSDYYSSEVAPIERVLLHYRNDEELASRIAATLVREASAVGVEPRLLLAVLLVENPWLDPDIRSSVGAVGLMQVMPVHRGGWSCGYDLEDIDTNVCLGARVFRHYLDRTAGDLERALLRYNGCVTGSNTPNCHLYPSRVLAHVSRANTLAWGGQGPSAASP